MRSLLTIARYEFRMQVRSGRFILLCLLALGASLFIFAPQDERTMGMNNSSPAFMLPQFSLFYFAVAAYAGVFAVSRIRGTGMHPILMVRPFPTFTLLLGQLIAGTLSLLIPTALATFPSIFLVRYLLGRSYPLPHVAYMILFHFAPMIWCIMAMSLWVRACFKNNIAAFVVLGALILAIIALGNGLIMQFGNEAGFIPIASLFSHPYSVYLQGIWQHKTVSFLNLVDWGRMGLSFSYALLFLLLACYHLRRTEPQRKVLGDYGKRWDDMPTFVRMACDLRIDPHVGWKTHAAMAAMVAIIAANTGWPLAEPYLRNFVVYREMKKRAAQAPGQAARGAGAPNRRGQTAARAPQAGAPTKEEEFASDKFPQDKVLPVTVLENRLTRGPKAFEQEMLCTLDADPAGKFAVGMYGFLLPLRIEHILIDGKQTTSWLTAGTLLFISGDGFSGLAKGSKFRLRLTGSLPSGAQQTQLPDVWPLNPRGLTFYTGKKSVLTPSGDRTSFFVEAPGNLYPIHYTLTTNVGWQLLSAPADPRISPGKDLTTYEFDIPREYSRSTVYFAPNGDFALVDLKNPALKIRFAVPKDSAGIVADLADLMGPEIEDFCKAWRIAPARPLVLFGMTADWTSSFNNWLPAVENGHRIYVRRRVLPDQLREDFKSSLRQIEMAVLTQIFSADLCEGRSQSNPSEFWDLPQLFRQNVFRGLDHRLFPDAGFVSPSLNPGAGPMDVMENNKIGFLSRQELLDRNSGRPPIFQMLYFLLGEQDWTRMLAALKEGLRHEPLSPDLAQKAVESVTGKPYGWFFDYWLRGGKGYPSYVVEDAKARMTTDDDGRDQYAVEIRIRNAGTGKMLVPVTLSTTKQNVSDKIWIDSGETVVWKTTSRYLPTRATVDPRGWIMTAPHLDEQTKQMNMTASRQVVVEGGRR